ncbi:MAG: hypothetical protein ACPGO5_03620 [Patescibacteria group bacterium]
MAQENKPRLTDFHTFWKLIVLVVVALFAEGALLVAATSEEALNWTASQVYNPHRQTVAEVDVEPVE